MLHRPLLYLSYYLKRRRAEYYDRLTAIRDAGDWEGWLRFFLRGVAETAEEATVTARAIVAIREQARMLLQEKRLGGNAMRLLDLLFEQPIVDVRYAEAHLAVSFATANKLIDQFVTLGLLDQITVGSRNRLFRYTPYLTLFADRPPDEEETMPLQRPVSDP
ncbi:MAG TPA: hypothetical protein PKA95_14015 [Thermomicrobiales bacterium]|nr:hypothetical protein [Thermomicrobiales bacterium]